MIPKVVHYLIISVLVFLFFKYPTKLRDRIILIVIFLVSVFLFYFWLTQKVPDQQRLVSIHGRIVEAYYGKGDAKKDILFRLEKNPIQFVYLSYFPNYREVDTQIRIDNVLTIWYEPKESKSHHVWRIDNEKKTVVSFSEVAESYEGNSRLSLYMGILFFCIFIGFIIKESYRHKHVAA